MKQYHTPNALLVQLELTDILTTSTTSNKWNIEESGKGDTLLDLTAPQ